MGMRLASSGLCCKALPLLGILAAWPAVRAGEPHARFPFVIPGDDASPTATDMSGHLSAPAGSRGFVTARDGHLYTGDRRLRIWGVNTCFGANFPAPDVAEKVAAHLAKLGVNGVRMHHHDNTNAPRGLWKGVADGVRRMDPDQLDRQDYFLDQLHRRGIYANLNLHVSRTLTEAEGFVSRDLPRSFRYNKYLLYFEPRMREAFKDFCRQYLFHRNPFRKPGGLRRVNDPGIALIEITNENPFSREGPEPATTLPEPYRGEFRRQWNGWLAENYPSTRSLREAWGEGGEPLGEDIAPRADFSRDTGPWSVHQRREAPIDPVPGQPGPEGRAALKLSILNASEALWHQELSLSGLSVERDLYYTLSFWARADTPRTFLVDVSRQGPPNWNAIGLSRTVPVGPRWQRFEWTFQASETRDGNARICFKFGGSDADLWLADIRLRRGGRQLAVPEGQSLEQRNIDIPTDGWVPAARQDAHRFMVDVEMDFARDIVRFLKEDLGVQVPITCSQISYHHPSVVAETCDYTDMHAYWQHPRFPGRPWDPANWRIDNTPMERAPGADSLSRLATWRLLDRPFTVSEWNIPSPHDYGASVVPFAAMATGLQDWDGVFFFQYHSQEDNWFADRLMNFFSFNGHPAKLVMLTAFANAVHRGDLDPLEKVAAGTLTERLPAALALRRRIGIDPEADRPDAVDAPADGLLTTPDGSAVWDARNDARAHVTLNSPATRAVWGLVAGQTFQLGGLKLAVGGVERDYAAIVATSLDGKSLERSSHILLAAVGSAENADMGWNEDRTSVGRQWGRGPSLVNGVPVRIVIEGAISRAFALDGAGARGRPVPVQRRAGGASLDLGPEYETLWYELVAE